MDLIMTNIGLKVSLVLMEACYTRLLSGVFPQPYTFVRVWFSPRRIRARKAHPDWWVDTLLSSGETSVGLLEFRSYRRFPGRVGSRCQTDNREPRFPTQRPASKSKGCIIHERTGWLSFIPGANRQLRTARNPASPNSRSLVDSIRARLTDPSTSTMNSIRAHPSIPARFFSYGYSGAVR